MDKNFYVNNIKWEIESDCNLNCRHCFMGNTTRNLQNVTYEDAISIVDKLICFGVKSIVFTTMEPLMFAGICSLIQYCTLKGIVVTLSTNGTLLVDYSLAEKLIHSGVSTISISLEGISEYSNDYIRGKGTLKKVLKAIENLHHAQERGNRIYISIHMSLNKYSALEADEISEYINNLNVNSLHIGSISISGNAKDNVDLQLSEQDYKIAWEKISDGYEKLQNKKFVLISKSMLPLECVLSNIKKKTDYKPLLLNCSVTNNGYSLLPDGTLTPCVVLKANGKFDMPTSNIYNMEKVANKFYEFSTEINEYISIFKNNNTCKQCHFRINCYPCPGEINKSTESLSNRCSNAQKEIESLLDGFLNNPTEYSIAIRPNVLYMIEGGVVIFKRNYQYNGFTSEKRFEFDYNYNNLVKRLFQEDSVKLECLLETHNQNNKELPGILLDLLYYNFIFIKEGK